MHLTALSCSSLRCPATKLSTCPLASTMADMVLLAVPLLATGASFSSISGTDASTFLLLLPAFVSLSLPGGDGAMVLLSL